jgi:hypothetical protein
MRLRRSLGDWNHSANDSERIWPFYSSKTTDNLYRKVIKKSGTDKETSTTTVTPGHIATH